MHSVDGGGSSVVCTYVVGRLDCLVASRMAWMHGIVLQIVRVLAILNTIVVCNFTYLSSTLCIFTNY